MIVTSGFRPAAEADLPNIGPLTFVEYRDGAEGLVLRAICRQKGELQGTWDICVEEPNHYMLVPRRWGELAQGYTDHFYYTGGRTAFVEWAIKVASPLNDYCADRLTHYRIVTDSFFLDFLGLGSGELELKKIVHPGDCCGGGDV